jgi:hypothetical protein
MSLRPHFNRTEFNRAHNWAETHGFDVIDPHQIDLQNGFDSRDDEHRFGDYFTLLPPEQRQVEQDKIVRRDIALIMGLKAENHDTVLALWDWKESKGARAEIALAVWRGIPVGVLNREIDAVVEVITQ